MYRGKLCIVQVVSGLRGEVQALQTRLTENQAMALQEDDKLRELRRLQRELKQQNADLSTRLSMVQVYPTPSCNPSTLL